LALTLRRCEETLLLPAVALLTRLLTDEDWSLWLLEQRLVGLAASGN